MAQSLRQAVSKLLSNHEAEVLAEWQQSLKADGALKGGRVKEAELAAQCAGFLRQLRLGFEAGATDADSVEFAGVREMLADLSRARALQGFSPRDTAIFVFSLKQPLFSAFDKHGSADAAAKLQFNSPVGLLLDRMGLHTMDVFHKAREELIVRQEREIAELSTPVIKLWHGILALPLIGTLDSQRTQVVMENLLESIVAQEAEIAIIDITGVPTVDTLTAQHLLKTVSAARLMGADCIISGIRPQIAQTMVHLGVELTVISKATLADAFALALKRQGRAVTKVGKPEQSGAAS
jgi:rsbT co-antagonist protein RsbR